MTDPITYSSTSPRFELPFLFAGQAQKEFFVNEALQRIDMLMHCAVEAESDSPPNAPEAGQCWLIGNQPSGVWAEHAAKIACWSGEMWIFATPRGGMRAYDKGAGQMITYKNGGWQRAISPNLPAGGAVIDAELRTAFENLLEQLRFTGVIA